MFSPSIAPENAPVTVRDGGAAGSIVRALAASRAARVKVAEAIAWRNGQALLQGVWKA